MKYVTARATFSDVAKNLFSTKDSSRETASKVLNARSTANGKFVVGKYELRTERAGHKAPKK